MNVSAVALLYDIHGNLPALTAVLDDAGSAGVDRMVLGGDYALFGPQPAETIAALRALPAASWIRGNGERWTAAPAQAPVSPVVQGAIAACRGVLGVEIVEQLAALPEQIVLAGTRYCHGSPLSDVHSFPPEDPAGAGAGATGAPAQSDEALLDGVTERRLVFGHTHLPFRRLSDGGVELVNPGSIGMPFDGDPRAAYAVLHGNGQIEHRRVAYDHEASAVALRERFGEADWTATVARRLVSARP